MSMLTGLSLLAAETEGPAVEGHPFEVPEVGLLFNYTPLFELDLPGLGHVEVTWPMIVLGIVTVLVFTLFVLAFRKFRLVPKNGQLLGETAVGFVRDQIVNPTLGPDGGKYLPFLTTIFFWVLALNVMGIIPGVQFPITSRMAIPALLAIIVWIVYNYVGIKKQGPIGYFKNMMFPPGVPKPIYVVLAPLELISTVVVRPVTLAVRLFANMVAGHIMLVVLTLATATFAAAPTTWHKGMMAIPFGFGVIMTGFEIFVAGMQAFIITILTAVYIAGAQEAHH